MTAGSVRERSWSSSNSAVQMPRRQLHQFRRGRQIPVGAGGADVPEVDGQRGDVGTDIGPGASQFDEGADGEAVTTVQSSSPARSEIGARPPAPCTSNQAALGRIRSSSRSTAALAMSCSRARSSTRSSKVASCISIGAIATNTKRPHSARGYLPPAVFAALIAIGPPTSAPTRW